MAPSAGRSAQRLKINLSHVVSLPGSRILFIYLRKSLVSDGFRVAKQHFLISPPWLAFENWQLFYPVTLKLLHCGENLVWDRSDSAAWSSLLGKNVQKQTKKILFKTQVVTMCSFSSGKPANIIAMFDTIFKTSRVKCYSSLPMLLRAPRACLASVLPQTVLPTILPIWSPLDQLASAPVRWWSQPPGLCQHLPHTLELQPLLLKQLGWCHSQALKATYFYRLPPKENQLISKQGTKKQTCYHWKSHNVPIYIKWELKPAACRTDDVSSNEDPLLFAVISRSCSTMCWQPPGKHCIYTWELLLTLWPVLISDDDAHRRMWSRGSSGSDPFYQENQKQFSPTATTLRARQLCVRSHLFCSLSV